MAHITAFTKMRVTWRTLSPKARRWILIPPIVAALFVIFARPITDFAIGNIYKNVAEPLDKELPVTVTAYPSGPDIVGIIGGKGEGLNCSLPPGIDFVFTPHDPSEKEFSPVSQRFRQACVFHDLCYRHGLATYGYSQNDCDDLLQEQALRICISVMNEGLADVAKCQLDSKKVAAGVKFGGFKFFKGWGESTYFEFDTIPYRSVRHIALRVIDQPFGSVDSQGLPEHLLLRFTIRRSGVVVTCLNCPHRNISDAQFALADLPNPPGHIRNREMHEDRDIALPRNMMMSAPHLLTEGNGRQLLVWFLRERIENSGLCVAVVDPKVLLTDTSAKRDGCSNLANDRLKLGQVDLLTSSPQPALLAVPGSADADVIGTGFTAQHSPSLEFCISPNLRAGLPPRNPDPVCATIRGADDQPIVLVNRFGAFQNIPVNKDGREIYLWRSMIDNSAGGAAVGRALVVDPKREFPGSSVTHASDLKLAMDKGFNVPDDYDPMLPLSKDKNDLKLLSVSASNTWANRLNITEGRITLKEIDFASPDPKLVDAPIDAGSAKIDLHQSWARRPILIVNTGNTPVEGKAQLVLSRSVAVAIPGEKITGQNAELPKDQVRFEFLTLDRQGTNNSASYKPVAGLACTVTYTILRPDRDAIVPCGRSISNVGIGHATPATLLQGAQMVLGKFREHGKTNVALVDVCMQTGQIDPSEPIIREMVEIGASTAADRQETIKRGGALKREVVCSPIANVARLAEKM